MTATRLPLPLSGAPARARRLTAPGLLALLCALPLGCGAEGDSPAAPDETASPASALTGSNPSNDSDYINTITLRGTPSGVSYSDFAITSTHYYLARTDGKVEKRVRDASATFDSYLAANYQHLNYVVGGSWRMIGSNDAARKIYTKIDNVPSQLTSYPTGVNSLIELAGRAGPNNTLEIFIVYNSSSTGPVPVLRKGVYNPLSGMSWGTTTIGWGQYNHGLCVGDGKLRSVVDFTTSYLITYDTQTLAKTAEPLSPYTEHSYAHPAGFQDRYNPIGFDSISSGYWGIDVAVDASGKRTWVIAHLPFNNVR